MRKVNPGAPFSPFCRVEDIGPGSRKIGIFTGATFPKHARPDAEGRDAKCRPPSHPAAQGLVELLRDGLPTCAATAWSAVHELPGARATIAKSFVPVSSRGRRPQ